MDSNLCQSLPLGRSLAILAKTYFGALTKELEHLQVERYYSILIIIENSEGPCTQQYICDKLKIDKVSMVRIIDYLLKKKLVKKILNPTDRRAYLIQLTPLAKKILPEIHDAIERVNQAAFKDISISKQKEIYNQLSQIHKNLDRLPAQKIYINYKKASKKG